MGNTETSDDVHVRLERRKGISFNLELHKSSSGYPIFLRISEGGQHKRFNSSIKLKRKADWDSKHQKIRSTEPKYEEWQQVIDDLKEQAKGIHRKLEKESSSSAEKIIDALRRGANSTFFLRLAEKKVEECRQAGRLSSMNKYEQVCRKFKAFMNSRGIDPYSISFTDIDYTFIADFDAYMQTLDNKQYMKHDKSEGKREKPDVSTAGARKLHPNYIAKILQYTSSIFESAEKARLIRHEDNPFNSYSIKKVKTDREELTLEEVQRIIHLDLQPNTREWHSRNFFLFAMYCAGIRIGDVLCLRWSNITDDNRLHYQMGKNHKIQDLPLLPPALEILDLYRTGDEAPNEFVFPYMKAGKYVDLWSDVKSIRDFDSLSGEQKIRFKQTVSAKEALVNNGLKIIREKAGISKPLSTHIARHTFARLAKEVHTDNSLLQGLLMHSSVSTTEQYMGRFSTSARDEALKEIFKPLAPEMMRKKELLDQLAQLSEEELEAIVAEHKKNKKTS